MRMVLIVLARLLGLAVLVQIFLAGFGAINPAPVEEAFVSHRILGMLLLLLSLLVVGAAALARAPRRLIGMTAVITGLMVLQMVISLISDGSSTVGQLIFGLHAVNALAIMFAVGTVNQQAMKLPAGTPDQEPVAA